MKASNMFEHAAKLIISLNLFFAGALLLPAQSKDKQPTPPPRQNSAPAKPAAAPVPQQHPPQQQQQHAGQPRPGQTAVRPGPGQTAVRPGPGQTAVKPGPGQTAVKPGPGQAAVKPGPGQTAVKPGPRQTGVKPGSGQTAVKPEPGLTKTPKGGTLERRTDGSSIERDKNNHVTGVTTRDGHKLEYRENGHLDRVVTNKGAEAHFNARGKVSAIKTPNGTVINRGPNGERHIISERRDANHRMESRVVSTGPNRGFVEHRFERGGHEYMRRTYVYQGRTTVTVYRTSYYGGVAYYHYVPAYYYAPVYYGWAYNPWPAPVYYTWGWYGAPWYAPYGYYFSPYPAYPSAAFWLTDYLISENLKAAYEARAAANEAASEQDQTSQTQNNAVALSPEVKQMIADEVKTQLAAERAAAVPETTSVEPTATTEQVPPALDPNLRVFIVTTSLDVTASGQECSLSPGDVLMRTENTADKDNTVGVSIVSSQKSSCSMGSSPRVQVADLQEMHNHFREQLDNGLKTLADNQGKNGIPSGPTAGGRKNPDGTAAQDLTASTDLQKQQQDADQSEKEVQQASSSTGSGGGN